MSPSPLNLEIAIFTLSSALLALQSGVQRIEFCSAKDQDGLTPNIEEFIHLSSILHPINTDPGHENRGEGKDKGKYEGGPGAHEKEHCFDGENDEMEKEKSKRKVEGNVGQINIMIRPYDNSSPGSCSDENFRVSDEVFEQMKKETALFRSVGGDGFVFGILKDDSEGKGGLVIDEKRCAELIAIAREGDGGERVRCTFHRAFDRIDGGRMEEQLEIVSYAKVQLSIVFLFLPAYFYP